MKVFNKLVFICNVCCFAFPFFRLIQFGTQAGKSASEISPLPPVAGIVAVLAIGAVFINLIFVLVFLIRFFSKGLTIYPKWITYFNLIIFPLQIWYFFFSKLK